MEMKFWKMHGAQNDFVLFDDRKGGFPVDDHDFIAHIAARRSGVGSDGVILIQASERADFFMKFFNPDGRAAEMCGNGARCAALLASELGVAGLMMTIDTVAGEVRAQIQASSVCLWMTQPRDWVLNGALDLDGRQLNYAAVNSGVPHVVMRTEGLREVDVQAVGAAVRRHRKFAPAGTNVNFVQVLPQGDLSVRTYERGVESETLACGTGVTACGVVAARNGWVTLPVRVYTHSGDLLLVDGELTPDGVRDVTLTGPAEHVFEGMIDYGGYHGC